MKCQYKKLMSPVKVGNVMLKNRIINSPQDIHFIQGNEPWPTEAVILWLAERAKNGCALINVSGIGVNKDTSPFHSWAWDMTDGHTQHYLSQLTEAVHFYGAKVNTFFRYDLRDMYPGKDISTGKPTHWTYGDGSQPRYDQVAATTEELEAFAEDFAEKVKVLNKECGFDGLFMHMSYRASSFGRSLSPLINDRTDKFGGSLENRCRYPLLVADLVREKCGPDFIIECTVSADPEGSGGNTEDDLMEIIKLLDGHFDIITPKAHSIDPAHCVQFQDRTPWLYLAARAKQVVKKSLISSSGGYFIPEDCEKFIEEGKLDLISSARAWIADPEFGTKIYENRAEDIVPCVRCNKCHKSSMADVWAPFCTVNPLLGWDARKVTLFGEGAKVKKTVAVVGGGPAGMQAALEAAKQGHSVTLYEKTGVLGGQLEITKDVDFKYPLQDFKKYLVHQVEKSAVDVHLNCAPTVEELNAIGYDAVIVAIGSVPAMPPIPGIDGKNVIDFIKAYEDREALGQRVVVIGGGEIGTETAMYIAQTGRDVSVIEMKARLADDATPVHYYSIFEEAYKAMENLHPICSATATGIDDTGVTYKDAEGEHRVEADTVVICAGMKALRDEAYAFADAGDRFYVVGDCEKVGNVQKALRTGFATANNL